MFIFIILSYVALCTDCLSTKKGLAVPPDVYQCGDLDYFTNINWWYDYTHTSTANNSLCNDTMPGHVPMVWGHSLEAANLKSLDSKVILGFNEPNNKNQANMSPEEAAVRWKDLEAAAAPDQKLVSPSASFCKGANCNMRSGKRWFRQFFKACKDCRVDYLATHAFDCNTTVTMEYLEDLWTTFKKPIWLTEFACGGRRMWSFVQLEYMKEILPLLEAAEYIHKYAWYASRHSGQGPASVSTNLLSPTNMKQLGQFYNDY